MKKYFVYLLSFLFLLISTNLSASNIDDANKLWWQGDYTEATQAYQNIINTTPEDTDAYIQLATLYKSTNKYDDAISTYNNLLTLNLDEKLHENVLVSLAECYYYSNKLKDALNTFQKTLEINPNNFYANFGLGRTLLARKKYKQAIKYFKKTIELDSTFTGSYYYLGRLYHKLKDAENSSKYYRKVLSKDIYFVEARFPLSDKYINEGQYEKAYKQLHRLIGVDAKNSLVNTQIASVKPLLTKSEKEIIPTKKQKTFLSFKNVKNESTIPLIKVGLNSNTYGKLNTFESVSFKSNNNFKFVKKGKGLTNGKPNITYKITLKNNKLTVMDSLNNKIFSTSKNIILKHIKGIKNSFIIEEIKFAGGHPWAGIEDRQYRGSIELVITKKGIKIINIVNVEEYLYSVLSSEMMSWWPMKALKAQAIIARSYLFYRKDYSSAHSKDGFGICDSQHCQVYKGISSETKRTNQAVDSTRAKILTSNGKTVNGLYHSNCGGHTQGSGELKGWYAHKYLVGVSEEYDNTIFPSAPSGLESWIKSKPIVYCNQASLKYPPSFRWFRVIPIEYMEEKINRKKTIGKIKKIIPVTKNSAGNINKVIIKGSKGNLTITKENLIRRLLGVGPLRSTLFWIETRYKKNNKPFEFIIYGGGWGHGVGMCQTGAAGMALQNKKYSEILKHYFKGTKIKNLKY